MTKEQVQTLRDAGVNESAIIDRILQDMQAPSEPEETPAPAPDPEPAPAPKDRTDEILARLDKLTGVIQKSNQHGGRNEASGQSVDDILASVLTPAGKNK